MYAVDTDSGTMAERIPVRLVPVEVFGGQEDENWGYGLCDAVVSWSDCNRAVGHIYRFDDIDPEYRKEGETLTVWVDPDEYRAFAERKFGNA